MKKTLLFLVCLLPSLVLSQIRITGTVSDQNGNPLEGASVYLNNTSIGNTTNAAGEFSLSIPKGEYQLVASYLGFESQLRVLNTKNYPKSFRFILKEKSDVLDEIVLKRRKKLTVDQRKDFLRLFQREFIGTSKVAERCRILNRDALIYDFDPITRKISISASEPLQISNPSLGYILYYDLIHFEWDNGRIFFAGNIKFEETPAKERKKKRLRKNRLRAYKGSQMHFLQSLLKNEVKEQGFVVHQVVRIPIERESSNNVKWQQYKEEVVDWNLAPYEYSRVKDGTLRLRFKDHLRIIYEHEFPDENYRQRDQFNNQVTLLSLNVAEAEIHQTGVIKNPSDFFLVGYWSFEKVGDLLPLDFKP
jgi:hypothetical protein